MNFFVAVLMLGALSMAALSIYVEPDKVQEAMPRSELQVANGYLTKWHDDKEGVTCYIWDGHAAGGISCIPDSQLEKKK